MVCLVTPPAGADVRRVYVVLIPFNKDTTAPARTCRAGCLQCTVPMSNCDDHEKMKDAVVHMLQQVRVITGEGMVYTVIPTATSSMFQSYVVRRPPSPPTRESMTARVGAT